SFPQPTAAARQSSASVSTDWNQRSLGALSETLQSSGDSWWDVKGRQLKRPIPSEWANCLLSCSGVIAFDAILCQGPRHRNSHAAGNGNVFADQPAAVATYSLAGCEGCGKAPEG